MPFIVEANPDVVLLSGYFRILPDFFLEQFPDTKNTHCMDLSWIAQREQKDSPLVRYRQLRYVGGQDPNAVAQLEDVERAFKGESAVFDLLQSARIIRPHPKLRATVHRAIPEYDEGLIEVQSAPVEVDWDLAQRLGRTRNWGELMKYADLLQGELKVKGDIPATITAIELTSDGRLDHHDGAVYVDDIRMPVHGLRLDKWEDPKRVET
ncbi:MAG: hypothetical protein IH899_19500 [Planctomycetes bacterium]|nr:hypothetical protein [Planctomycetota bacterium]